jgi:signal transduction histidine kinase
MSRRIAEKAWAKTPLGPVESWPASLVTTVSLCLGSNFPINIIWGPEHIQIYNDGYRLVCGAAHPRALGEPYTVTWASAWPALREPFERALAGQTSFLENQRMFLERNGFPEETFFTFSLSPIRNESGKIVGLFHPVTETTAAMLSERRTRALRDVADKAGAARRVSEACALTVEAVSRYPRDIPFMLLYLAEGASARLAGAFGVDPRSEAAPSVLPLRGGPWPLHLAAESGRATTVSLLGKTIAAGEYPEPLREAAIVPLAGAGREDVLGFLVLGISPRLPFDDAYTIFLTILGEAVRAAVMGARSFEEEKQRAEAIAELDRAKTAFFSNVSHEFRTPLTLILGPLEDLLGGRRGAVEPSLRGDIEVVHRNALRLLKLVNALLDFSRLDAGRMEAVPEPTDLATLTRELASAFESAVERAGMRLVIDTPPLSRHAFVDRDMWEKIVLNLLSNALKYTQRGEIRISLAETEGAIELVVRDTGSGIPEQELPYIFDRFHRVHGTGGRSHEGTGIGLALVQELVKLHGGSVAVASQQGTGSTFTVRLPRGLRMQTGIAVRRLEGAANRRAAFVEDAIGPAKAVHTPAATAPAPARILLADDNADMREYVRRLLADEYEVETVPDGQSALEAARERVPDLIVSDVMMPRMDGIELLHALRNDDRLKTVPIVLLSARAGEEAKASGIEEGADDYLVKPFAARELLARVRTQIELSRMRAAAAAEQARSSALARAHQMRDDFLDIISHELRTPLTSLRMQLQLAERRLQGADGRPEHVDGDRARAGIDQSLAVSLRQVDRLARLVSEIVTVERLQAGTMTYAVEPVDLVALTRAVAETYAQESAAAEARIAIDAAAPVIAACDRMRVEQALRNLLANATKYGAGEPVSVSVAANGQHARIAVQDHGIGVPEDKQQSIFDRFERAISHRNISGLGLGLYIARQIAVAHGGDVELESKPGRGARFTLVLPLRTAGHDPRAEGNRAALSRRRRHRRLRDHRDRSRRNRARFQRWWRKALRLFARRNDRPAALDPLHPRRRRPRRRRGGDARGREGRQGRGPALARPQGWDQVLRQRDHEPAAQRGRRDRCLRQGVARRHRPQKRRGSTAQDRAELPCALRIRAGPVSRLAARPHHRSGQQRLRRSDDDDP